MIGGVGYRFHPTDEELVDYFLKHKMDGYDFLVADEIRLIDLYRYEPWELPRLAAQVSNDQVWYFFCKRELKYKNSTRPRFNRSTDSGHWRPTGNEHIVKAKGGNQKIGTKRTLVFYLRSSPRDIKTNWVIHEYKPKTVLPHQKDFVLCKLKEKPDKDDSSGSDQAESSNNNNRASDRRRPLEIPTPQHVDPEDGINFDNGSAMRHQIRIEDPGISLDDLIFESVFHDADEPQENLNELADSFIGVPDEQSGEKFLHSLSADGPNHQENLNTNLRNSCSPQSIAGVYLADIDDLDTQIACERSLQFGASKSNSTHANSSEYRQMQRVQTITETLPSSTFNQSGKYFQCMPIFEVQGGMSAKPEQKAIEATSTRTSTQKPISGQVMAAAAHQGKMSIKLEHKARDARKNDAALDFLKENNTIETGNDHKTVKSETNMTGNGKIGSFIHQETSLLSQQSVPVSVYIVNLIVGLILLIAAIREMLIFH